ncbi:MAG: hypothetical protein WC767_03495, partial [Candidatus Paceibacterota bacterium]
TVVWSSDLSTQILSFLDGAGLKLENGVAYVRNLVADVVTAKKLVVGDSANLAAAGVTVLDRVTGEPACVYVANNVMRSDPGACDASPVISAPVSVPAVEVSPEPTSTTTVQTTNNEQPTTPTAETTATTTTD